MGCSYMKVYISDDYKLGVFSLPDKVEDEFLINYVSPTGIEETITLTAENNKWYIASSYDVNIYSDNISVKKEALVNDKMYQIKFSDLENSIMLYCFDIPIQYYNFAIGNKQEIVIGPQQGSDIMYNNTFISGFKIYRYNNCWVYEATQNSGMLIYVNQKRCNKTILNLGDVIFTNGLKLIWMNDYLSINNPNNKVKTTLQQYEKFNSLETENSYTPVKDTEKNLQLYTEKQVFFHTPRLRRNITEKVINIEKPPEKVKPDTTPAFLTYGATIMMGLSSSITGVIAIFNVASGEATLLSSVTEITICISMIVGTIMFPIMQDKYQKKKIKKDEDKRQKRYTNYLQQKNNEIQEETKKEIEILFANNLSAEELQNAIINKTANIWSREIPDSDFLTLRLGLGNKKASIKVEAVLEEFSLEDDNLKEQVKQIKNTPLFLQNVPITVSLIENNVLPVIINDDYPSREISYKQPYIDWLSLQIMTYYSGVDLKIVILTTEENENKWDHFKYLPHCYNNEHTIRLFATNEDEVKTVTSFLESEYQNRLSSKKNLDTPKTKGKEVVKGNNLYQSFEQYYLIITDNYIDLKDLSIIKKILNIEANLGFSLLIIGSTMSMIPSRCKKIVELSNTGCKVYNKEENNQEQAIFNPEFFVQNIGYYSRILANIPAYSLTTAMSLPSSLTFLEMYRVGKIEQLNIINRWTKNDPTTSLHTPLGVKNDGKLLEIDLHEKFHGPHGLIAGSTGSGKSEFIITFILSMAVNYHPYEVQFVLIDYKGGGLAGAFENRETGVKIPHLAGTITNLDTNEMNRTLVSINSELKRREKAFNQARDKLGESTVDIYKYQKFYREGKVEEPISHLFIISDEFAELKAQQPDFMAELVSTARIGRSLGVHLILATQKPTGVVDDQIWSNSRFKICLKVQTTEDSMELLKRPEAAMIKETGRFYLQVGYDELFVLSQSAWAGAKYNPTERILKSIDDSIDIIDHNGTIIKKINDRIQEEEIKDYGDQLTNIVKYLYNVAKRDNIEFKSLWLPSIPKDIYISSVIEKYQFKAEPYEIVGIIGEYDDPAKQTQGILTLDLTNTGGLIIYGNAGSGKENLLTTLIYSIGLYHTPEEVNFYIFDFGAETLKVFNNMPHVGDVVLVNEKEKIKSALLFFERELSRRKEIFSEFGGTYASYIKTSGQKMPLIVVIINAYESFVENHANYSDFLVHILRDSSKYGIVFITTTITVNSISSIVSQTFNNKLAMQLTDNFEYKYTFMAPYGLSPAKYFGRGIITIDDMGYEFQTAYIYYKEDINDVIKITNDKLREKFTKIPKIPVIPQKVTSTTLSQYINKIKSIPVGVDVKDASIVTMNLEKYKVYPIIGNEALVQQNFLNDLINVLQSLNKTVVKVIDFVQSPVDPNEIAVINGEYTQAINNIEIDNQNTQNYTIYLILGIGKIYDNVLDEGIAKLFSIFKNAKNYRNVSFILMDNYASYKKISNEDWFVNRENNPGIWLGEDIKVQNIFDIKNLTRSDFDEDFPGLAYSFENDSYQVFKTIGITGEEVE